VIFLPNDRNELIRQINRHHIPLFDNMSRLSSEQSDILCLALPFTHKYIKASLTS